MSINTGGMRRRMRRIKLAVGLAIVIAAVVALAIPAAASAVIPTGNANGEIQMNSPAQKIHFNIAQGDVEYWNYEYFEGSDSLHYSSTITCSSVNPDTREARFMFQIPAGHPGLSGLYVVSYIKIVDVDSKSYLYGHAATSDLATATQWCQTGVGFSPGMYPVKSGVLYLTGGS